MRLRSLAELADLDQELLLLACTHASYASERSLPPTDSNQRLEFLGDAVLDTVVAEYLYEALPDWSEGQLTQAKAALVSERALARAAGELDLGEALRLGRGEESTDGRSKASVLAGAFEALVAALFLSGGLDRARQFVVQHLCAPAEHLRGGTWAENHKSALQELMQARCRETPSYEVVEARGPDHEKWFVVEVRCRGRAIGRGEGTSRRIAEQAAACEALATAQEWLLGPQEELPTLPEA